jgi:uncharacterized coiled-coil protein SlyX
MEPDENKPDELSPVDLLKTWSSLSGSSGSINTSFYFSGSDTAHIEPEELNLLIKNLSDSYVYHSVETDKSSKEYKELEQRLEQLKAGIECLNTTIAHHNVKIEEMRNEALALESEMDALPVEVKKNYIEFFSEAAVKKFSEDSLVIKLEKALQKEFRARFKPVENFSIIMHPETCHQLALELKHFSPELLSVSFNVTGARNLSFKGVPIIRSSDVNKDIFIIK